MVSLLIIKTFNHERFLLIRDYHGILQINYHVESKNLIYHRLRIIMAKPGMIANEKDSRIMSQRNLSHKTSQWIITHDCSFSGRFPFSEDLSYNILHKSPSIPASIMVQKKVSFGIMISGSFCSPCNWFLNRMYLNLYTYVMT